MTPLDILNQTRANLALGSPLDNFLRGRQAANTLQAQELSNEALTQKIAQAAAMNPLQLQAQQQAVQAGQMELDQAAQRNIIQGLTNVAAEAKALPSGQKKSHLISRLEGLDLQGLDTASLISEVEDMDETQLDTTIDNLLRQTTGGKESVIPSSYRQVRDGDQTFAEYDVQGPGGTIRTVRTPIVGDIVRKTTGETVAEERDAEVAQKQREKFAEKTGESRAKAIDTGFEQIGKISSNIGNINRAISAIDKGASTGTIESRFFPSLRQATKELDAIQKELGLDVIGSVTFGALSEGELNLALEVALPTNMEPQELKAYLQEKKVAQEKLKSYYEEQISFLDDGGTIAEFVKMKKDETTQQDTEAKNYDLEYDPQTGAFK